MRAARISAMIMMLTGLLPVTRVDAADTAAAFEAGKSYTGAVDPAAAARNGGNFTQGVQTFGIGNVGAMSQARGGGPDLAAPPEAALSTETTLDSTAAHAANPQAQWVTESATTRPVFNIDPTTDPLLKAGNTIKDNPTAIVGTLDQSYSGCTTLAVKGAPAYEEKVCQESRTINTATCDKILTVACDLPKDGCDPGGIIPNTLEADMAIHWAGDGAGNYILTFGTIANDYWGGWGAVYDRNMTFDIRDVGMITRFALTRATFDDWLMVKVNGTLVYVGPYGGDRLEVVDRCWTDEYGNCADTYRQVQYTATHYGGPELGTSWNFALDIDLKPYLKEGSNTVFVRTIVAGGGEGAIQITARQLCPRDCHDSWAYQCPPIADPPPEGSCWPAVKLCAACLEPAETRIIDGVSVTRDCWRYQDRYQYLGAETADTCSALRDAGCSQIGSICLSTDPSGACASYEQTYRCEAAPGNTTAVTSCGGTMTCIDGKCFDTAAAPNTDFALAATHLNVLQSAGQDFDAADFQIFKGHQRGCSKAFLAFSNCCGDSGWGLDLNLTRCSEEEKLLVQEARGGSCHLVSSYCSNKTIFGICTSTRLNWCCFNSKLARIVNEQGRPQLSKSWGSAESPDCTGFTPDQLQSLDFAAMDLSEFYSDVMAQAKGMDFNQAQQNLTNRITNYYNTGAHSLPAEQAAPYDPSLAPPAGN